MPRKYNLSITYEPKIEGVRNGTIRQTIRTGRRFQVGDLVSFHGWQGKPYRSPWSWRTPYFELTEVYRIVAYPEHVLAPGGGALPPWPALDTTELVDLARLDGIEPPTKEALFQVLGSMHDLSGGVGMQIIRWGVV